ncbi:stimulated by retinoic acid gene 6 protein-like isoform X1 [Nematostella vectensis]|uniref:stimulated by retinoic acid gene 6 protein-like isoform X1 n=2 Tax=Nematostella vectensis TaxID=45351 RepID=UPI0020771120|nr:stimulated by retinoic acid gene 6 protein-like isoform X1 [Nematostella vectensis]
MENATVDSNVTNGGNTSNVEFCTPSDDYQLYNQISLGPAVLIILILVLFKRRTSRWQNCCDGRPGILPPMDSLGSEYNRFSYAIAYAAMAVAVTVLFFNKIEGKTGQVIHLTGPSWVKVFDGLLTVILLGIIFLPIFLCLSTNARLLGAVMGLFYTAMRFSFLMVVALRCPLNQESVFKAYPIFVDLPTMMAYLFLMGRFLIIFVKEIRKSYKNLKTRSELLCGTEPEFKVNELYIAHVKTLLEGKEKSNDGKRIKWYKKGRNFVYTPNPDFKYSVSILSTVIVGGIIIYEVVILAIGEVSGVFIMIKKSYVSNKDYYIYVTGEENYNSYVLILDIIIATFIVSSIVAALYMYFQMYRMLLAHRQHVIKLMQGDRRFLPRKMPTPDNLVGMSLRFCGYQIAYFLWGYLIMFAILVAVVLFISLCVVILPSLLDPEIINIIINILIGLVPTVALALFVWLFQKILAVFVFKDRSINSKVVNIDNRRCYLLLSFFFFFFNILVGLMSCVLRILKGMLLGIMFIGRIDRPLLMKGFTGMDTAYMAYLGFLHLQVAHKHPVILVYCYILWNEAHKRRLGRTEEKFSYLNGQERLTDPEKGHVSELPTQPKYPRVSAWALNKWFVAVTIIRNPSLILNRKGFLKNVILGLARAEESSPDQARDARNGGKIVDAWQNAVQSALEKNAGNESALAKHDGNNASVSEHQRTLSDPVIRYV